MQPVSRDIFWVKGPGAFEADWVPGPGSLGGEIIQTVAQEVSRYA